MRCKERPDRTSMGKDAFPMKKYFMLGLAVIFTLILGLIAYGAYLNQQGELQIMQRMEERALPVHGAKVATREMRTQINLDTMILHAAQMADAVALIDGRVTEVYVQRGSVVQEGHPLFSVVNEKLPMQLKEAESNILKATAQLKRARNNYDRYRRLNENRATSTEKFEEAEAQYVAAEAYLEEAQAKKDELLVQASRQTVTAPVSGKILVVYREVGSYVQPGTALALVGNFNELYFDMPVEEALIRGIDVGQSAQLLFKDRDAFLKAYRTNFEAGNWGSQETFQATVLSITPPLSEPATFRSVRWQVENSAGLLEPQTYDNVILQSFRSRTVLSVPTDAMTDSSYTHVFVVDGENRLELREVEVGADNGEDVEILSGLSEGETVVVSGKEGLEEGMRVTVALEGE